MRDEQLGGQIRRVDDVILSHNPFRRIDTSSNTKIGLKTVWYDITSKGGGGVR